MYITIPKWALSNDAKMDIIIVNNINWNVMCQRQTILSNTPKHVVAATGSVYMRSLLLLLSIKFALLQWHFDRTNQTGLCLLSLTMCHIVSQCNFIALEKSVDRDEYNAPYITIKPMTFSIAWRFAVFTWHFIHCLVFEKKNPRYPAFTEQVLVVRTDPFCVYVCICLPMKNAEPKRNTSSSWMPLFVSFWHSLNCYRQNIFLRTLVFNFSYTHFCVSSYSWMSGPSL